MADPHTNPNDVALTETTFLNREAERAKLAMRKALGDAGAQLMHGVDPRGWAKDHPWYSLLGASVAGFTAACAVVPSEEQRAMKRLRAIDRALRARERAAAKERGEPDAGDPTDKAAKKAAKGSFGAVIMAEAMKMLRPVLMSSLNSFANRRGAPANGDGYADDASAAASDPAPGYSSPT